MELELDYWSNLNMVNPPLIHQQKKDGSFAFVAENFKNTWSTLVTLSHSKTPSTIYIMKLSDWLNSLEYGANDRQSFLYYSPQKSNQT